MRINCTSSKILAAIAGTGLVSAHTEFTYSPRSPPQPTDHFSHPINYANSSVNRGNFV